MSDPTSTELNEFLESLNGGVLSAQMASTLSDVARGVVNFGAGKKVGKVILELTLKQIGDNQQVSVSHKLETLTPTKKGKKREDATDETPMHVGRGGQLTLNAPKIDDNAQYALLQEKEKEAKAVSIVQSNIANIANIK